MTTMDLNEKMYQAPVLERIGSTDWIEGNKAPFVVDLDPTAVCDLACPGCISEDLVALGNRFTDARLMELGQELIDCGVKAVSLIGGGEPLAHRKVGELIELLGKNDIHLGLTTNGSFIDRYLDPISEYVKWTRVSMDAATEELFSVLRPTKNGKNKFDKIVGNMRLLAKSKKGKLGYSFLIQTPADGNGVVSNIHEIYAAALLARDIGCDYFEVKPSMQHWGGSDHALAKHSKVLMQQAKEEVERLDALETKGFKIFRAINLQYSLDGVEVDQHKSYKECPSTQLRTTVTPTGVFVCPYWRGKKRMQVGDLVHQSFKEMWDGELRKQVMDRLDASKDCNFHCTRHAVNELAFTIKQNLDMGMLVEGTEEFDRFI